MSSPISNASFSKSLLSGLLSGIIVALLNLIYMIVYRETTGFATAEIIMPFSIFLAFPLFLMMGGCAYYLLQRHLPGGTGWFIFFCFALMISMISITVLDTKQNEGTLLSGLRGLCLGMEVITCIFAAFLIPYFARHPKIYE